jgi:gliding motility-associated-like protein
MKKYFSIACALLISTATFSQNVTAVKANKLSAPNSVSKNVVRKAAQPSVNQNSGGNLFVPLSPQQKVNPLLNIGQINQLVVKKTIQKQNTITEDPIQIDTRDLKFSENGLLLSPDGYEIEFRTSGNRKVTDVCSTPRPYVMTPAGKNASCAFSVACDDAANRDAADVSAIKYFQLRWHVMMNGGATSNIDQSMIDAMMVTLNADYAIHNMVFCEDSARWVEDATNYFHDSNTEEVSLKTAYNQRPADLINIYVVGDMTAGGYARFPYDPMGGTNFRGGIVMNRGNCNATGHTLAHEMGHTFGLEHTFAGVDERAQCSDCYERVRDAGSGSSNLSGVPTPLGGPYTQQGDREGDWCSDTNPHNTNTYNCNTAAGPMGGCDAGPWQNAPVNNHMSYSFCDSQFTTQQRYRQHCMADAFLGSWIAYGGGICGAQPPVAEFSGTPTTWGSPSNVVFTDLSAPTAIIDTWTWNFNNAGQAGTVVPATFVGQTPPTIVYTLPGGAAACLDYEVSLTITSANGNDTETKTAYITVCPPAGDCDTLSDDYNNVGPTNTIYNGAFGLFTGVPNEGSVALADPAAFYEMYFTPNPTTSIVGGVNVALGGLNDPDDDMTVQIAIYNDDGAGFPDIGGGPIVVQAYSPTALGVPNGGFVPLWIPITNPNTPITTATFHVGVEIFPGDATDSLYVISNVDGEGDGNVMTNFTNSTGCGLTDFMDPTGVYCPGAGYTPVNFDMWIIPMMGEYAPRPVLTGFTETVVCDTSYVTLTDTVLYHDYGNTSALVGMSYTFLSDGFNINSTTPLGSIDRTYTTAGPDILRITAVNDCGRSDTTFWTIPYNFLPTPDAEFTKTQPNDVCIGDIIDFTANTAGYQDYNWDFGDGTVASSGSSDATTHTYTAAGTYYTTLTTTSTGYQPDDVFYFEDFDAGIPATYTLFDGDGQPDNYGINGSWVPFDFNNDGDAEAVSSSWWNPAALNPADDWLITEAIGVLPANQMLSWIGEASDAAFPDGYEVRISTTGALPTTVANFNTVLFSTTGENAFPTTRGVSLAAYAGQTVYIAFVNNSNDMNILMIDDVWVGTTGPGCVGSQHKDDFVVVIDCTILPPTADMDVTDSTGCAPLTVTFTDNSIINGGDAIDTWLWNFGDGTFYNTDGTPPPHVYTTPGTYFTSLEVCNAGGCTTDNISIVVGTGVTAAAGLNDTICGGTTATLAGNDPTPDAGSWTLISGSGAPTTPTAFGTGVTGLSAGYNEFAWTITGTGCITVDTVGIFISTQESAGLDDLTSTLCNTTGNTLDLNTLLSGNTIAGTWAETTASGQFTIATGVFDANTLTAGTYNFIYYVVGTAPCINDTADFTVTVSGVENAGLDDLTATLCNTTGNTLDLNTLLSGNTVAGTWAETTASGQFTVATGVFDANTLAAGAYNFIYYVPSSAPCANDTADFTVTVSAQESAGLDDLTSTMCNTVGNTLDLNTLLSGNTIVGTWAETTASGQFTVGTGVFDANTLTAGAYNFIYYVTNAAPCANDTADFTVTISGSENAGLDDLTATLCNTAGNTLDLNTLLSGNTVAGTWAETTASGQFTVGTGVFDANTLTAGAYNFIYYVPSLAPCANDTADFTVTVSTSENAGLDDLTASLCNAAGNTLDLNTLLSGNTIAGTWAETTASTQFTVGTGVFDASSLTAGTYNFIYYVTNAAPCTNDTADFTVTVTALDDPTFTYADFCAGSNGVSGAPTTAGGTYSFNPDIGDGSSIDVNTGAITNAQAGAVYNVQYLTPAGLCRDSLTLVVNVGTPVDAGTDGALTTCNTAGTTDLFSLLVGAQAGGIWTPAMASGTGVFNPAVDAAATYQYYIVGTTPCANDTADVVVTVNSTDDPTFTYADFCAAAGGISGVPVTAGGTYSFNPDLLDGALIDANSGAITNANADSTYNVQYLTPAGPCRDSLTIAVMANGIPTVSNILETCNVANTDYAVSFDVAGGTGGPYTVTENAPGAIGGTFVVNAWTSNLITAGVAYDFDVDDANGCGPVNVSGNKICICISDAGTMDVTPLDLCETDVATATQLTPFVLDPNDYVMYVLHTNNTGTLGTVLDTNVVAPTFSFSTPPLTAGVTYYISTVVGDSLGNFVDFNDGCLQVAPGTPVTWEQAPDAGANDSTTALCNSVGSTIDLNTLLIVPAGGVWAETTASGQFTVGTGVFDANGLAAGLYAFTYTVAGTNCPNDVSFFGVTVSSQESAGLDDLTSTLCNSNGSTLDLNTLLNGNTTPGVWAETTTSGQLNVGTGIFDGTALAAGTYDFIYYVANTAPCTNDTANFSVTISVGENAGVDDFTATLCNLGGTLDLNTLLVGNTTLGTWAETTASGQFTVGTGVFDGTALAAGAYNFVYYVTNTAPCVNDTANFTVTISAGENAGSDDLTATLCNTTGSTLDLNTLLVGNTTAGTWAELVVSGQFNSVSGVFDANGLVAGAYNFVYYVTNAAPCADDTAEFTVTITEGEGAGLDDLTSGLCNTAGSTLDLNTLLSGSSTLGTWMETSTSGQFTVATGVFDGNGLAAGTYDFIYYVTNTAPCVNDTANFTVTIGASESAGLDDLTSALCNLPGSTLDLNTLLNGSTVSGTWAETSSSVQLNTVTGVFDANGLAAGVYTFIYYVPSTLPCGNDTADFTVTVAACSLPVASFTSSAISVCVGDDITFTDNSTGLNINDWAWNFDFANSGGVTPAIANTQGPHVVNFSTVGTYNIQLLITDSVGTDDTTITVTVTDCITPLFTVNDTTVCAGDSLVFTDASISTAPIAFRNWEFDFAGAGGVFPTLGNQATHTVFYTIPGTYTAKLTVTSGAVTESVIRTITVTDCTPIAVIDTTGGTQEICKDYEFATFNDLSIGNPTSYLWTFPGGTPDTSTSVNPGAISYDSVGVYPVTLVVTNEYGTSLPYTFSNAVSVIDCTPAVAQIIMDDEDGEICENDCINFVYKDTAGVPEKLIWTFERLDSDTIIADTVPSFNSNYVHTICWNTDDVGTFVVKVRAWNQYNTPAPAEDNPSIDSIIITVHPNPNIFAGNDVTVEYSFDTYIRAEVRNDAGNIIPATGGTGEWSPTTFLTSPYDLGTPVIEPTDTTTYTYTFTDEHGCVASDDVTVNVDFVFNIGVPSAFAPNSAFNNILYVKGESGIKSINFTIFNRYGQKVFESQDVGQGWDGTHNGKTLNPGVFVYYVKATFIDGSVGDLKGNVTLVK